MDKLIKILILALSEELIAQGHRNTGALIDSFEGRVSSDGLGVIIRGKKYALYLDKGVKANRIPYSGRSGKGGTSKYIEGLIAYFTQKGAADPKAAAFATANMHKKGGMPTRKSIRFSKTGARRGFIQFAVSKNKEKIEQELFENVIAPNKPIDKKIDKIFNQIEFHGGGTGVGGGGIWIF